MKYDCTNFVCKLKYMEEGGRTREMLKNTDWIKTFCMQDCVGAC